MTSVDNSVPINRPVYAGQTIYEGTILKASGAYLTPTSASGDTAVAIADDAVVDDEGTARSTRSGEKIGVHLLGSGHMVRVKSTAVTYTAMNERVHVGNTAGYCMDNGGAGNGAKVIGTYMEDADVTATAGDLVTVLLDTHQGTAKGAGNS